MRRLKRLAVLSVVLALALLASCTISTQSTESAKEAGPRIVFEIIESPTDTPTPSPGRIARAANPATTARDPYVDLQAVPHGYISMGYITYINDNLYSRTPFSYREPETALWIVDQLLAMGYTQDDIEIQQFGWEDAVQWAMFSWETAEGSRRFWDDFPARGDRLSQNVILSVPGRSERVIVVGAHYDSTPYPGAADNASGVALLLESAERMLHQDNYYTIVYVFFGAEEIGILGSYFYLESLSETQREMIEFMVNADSLFDTPYPLYGAGYSREQVPQTNEITRMVDSIAGQIYDFYDIEILDFPYAIFWTTDHLPFLEAGYTVVVFAGLHESRLILPGQLRILHSHRDCIHYINENWPGKAERAMHAYSVFLERILLARYS